MWSNRLCGDATDSVDGDENGHQQALHNVVVRLGRAARWDGIAGAAIAPVPRFPSMMVLRESGQEYA